MSPFYFVFNTKKYNHYSTKKNCYWRVNFVILSIIFTTWNKQLRQQSKRKHPVNRYSVFFVFCFLFLLFFKNVSSKFKSSHWRCSVKKGVLKIFTKFTGKHLWLSPATLLKRRLRHRCFPLNFVKFLRTAFLQNTSGQLLLRLKAGEISKSRDVLRTHSWRFSENDFKPLIMFVKVNCFKRKYFK